MVRQAKFTLTFAPEILDHLDTIERKYHRLIQQNITEQLSYAPEQRTRNRKPLDQPAPFGATWEFITRHEEVSGKKSKFGKNPTIGMS